MPGPDLPSSDGPGGHRCPMRYWSTTTSTRSPPYPIPRTPYPAPGPAAGEAGLRPAASARVGRGLLIVDAVARPWGVRTRDPGKTVWAHLKI